MKDFDSLYFVGAGGIGMAALERSFRDCCPEQTSSFFLVSAYLSKVNFLIFHL